MIIEQTRWTKENGWSPHVPRTRGDQANLVLVFGGTSVIQDEHHLSTDCPP